MHLDMQANKEKKKKGSNMLKRIINFGILSLVCFGSLSAINIQEKMYIDDEEFKANTKGDSFHIHIGHNVWLTTTTVHKDKTGLFAYEHDILRSMGPDYKIAYEKHWKCPYCHLYWPIGKPCDNASCPSKYR
jgi:hypothetical protein